MRRSRSRAGISPISFAWLHGDKRINAARKLAMDRADVAVVCSFVAVVMCGHRGVVGAGRVRA
jgi:hypothetical protein